MKLIIITPVFCKSSSGAGVYYNILSVSLQKEGIDVTIISDRDECEGSTKVIALFPRWASRTKNFFTYIQYFFQNQTHYHI